MFNKKAYIKVYEDGTIKVSWTRKSQFINFGKILALLNTGQLTQIVVNAVQNRGLELNITGDNFRANSIIDEFVTTVQSLSGGSPSPEESPAVSAQDAFTGELEEEEEE